MIAYGKEYLATAQKHLGALFDTMVNGCECSLEECHSRFLQSPLSARFEKGDPAIVAGRSGEELALELGNAETLDTLNDYCVTPRHSASPEYWTGWALAFYQWASGFTFREIQRFVPIREVRTLYQPYHEMDIRQFCDQMDQLVSQAKPNTNVKDRRLAAGLSQSQLAAASGVPLRTLQQYEQGQKNINHARADYIESLARVLCCNPSDLLERRAAEAYKYAAVPL